MCIIKEHNITLAGGNEQYRILLKPLRDAYLPYLYKWNSDPEVLYWVEGDDVDAYPPETVHQIYGGISQKNHCFIIMGEERIFSGFGRNTSSVRKR